MTPSRLQAPRAVIFLIITTAVITGCVTVAAVVAHAIGGA